MTPWSAYADTCPLRQAARTWLAHSARQVLTDASQAARGGRIGSRCPRAPWPRQKPGRVATCWDEGVSIAFRGLAAQELGGRRLLEGLGEEGLLGDLMGWRGVEQAFGCVRGSSGQAWGCCPRV